MTHTVTDIEKICKCMSALKPGAEQSTYSSANHEPIVPPTLPHHEYSHIQPEQQADESKAERDALDDEEGRPSLFGINVIWWRP